MAMFPTDSFLQTYEKNAARTPFLPDLLHFAFPLLPVFSVEYPRCLHSTAIPTLLLARCAYVVRSHCNRSVMISPIVCNQGTALVLSRSNLRESQRCTGGERALHGRGTRVARAWNTRCTSVERWLSRRWKRELLWQMLALPCSVCISAAYLFLLYAADVWKKTWAAPPLFFLLSEIKRRRQMPWLAFASCLNIGS